MHDLSIGRQTTNRRMISMLNSFKASNERKRLFFSLSLSLSLLLASSLFRDSFVKYEQRDRDKHPQ